MHGSRAGARQTLTLTSNTQRAARLERVQEELGRAADGGPVAAGHEHAHGHQRVDAAVWVLLVHACGQRPSTSGPGSSSPHTAL